MLRTINFLLFVFLLGIGLFFTVPLAAQDQHKPLQYEVNVRAVIIPVFAVDAKGNPVYDLKEEEVEFFIDGSPFEIAQFTAFTFAEQTVAPTLKDGQRQPVKTLDRFNFIILDSVANSTAGVRRAREIALGIVHKSPAGDAFIIIETNPVSGMRYILGPETDKKKLTNAIKKIKMFGGIRYSRSMRKPPTMGAVRRADNSEPVKTGLDSSSEFKQKTTDYQRRMTALQFQKVEYEDKEYLETVKRFAYSLSQLKYALKTIIQPKTVFLISGGVPEHRLRYDVIKYYKFLGKSARAINHGGSMLYMVNSVSPKRAGAGETLRFMAKESGGKYFGGSDIGKIVTRVNKHTTAYYELAFYPGNRVQDILRIKLKCKRKGIELNTVNYAEKGTPYGEMKPLQKKLFALSVVTGGSWSRIVGQVRKIKLKKLKKPLPQTESPPNKSDFKFVSVPLPVKFRNRELDIFTINLEPGTMAANINMSHRRANDKLDAAVPVEKGKIQHVVVVEPVKTLCIYNRVK